MMHAMRRVEGKVALVMGGGQQAGHDTGNGRAVSQVFAREGAHVAVVDRDIASAQATVDLIAADGGTAFAVAADVTSEREVAAAVEACRSRWGRIDILHNNVGIAIAAGDAPIAELDIDVYDRHDGREPSGNGAGLPPGDSDHARSAVRRCPDDLVDRRDHELPIGDVSDLEVRGARPHQACRHLERVLRDPGQRHPAGPPRDPDGDRASRA